MSFRKFSVLISLGLVGVAHADPSGSVNQSILSGVQDTSNLWFGWATTGYDFSFSTQPGDPDFYLNAIDVVGGPGWDPNITFNSVGPTIGSDTNAYTLGTALQADHSYFWDDLIRHDGAFDSTIAPGLYSFDVVFSGGSTPTSADILYTQSLQVEIVERVDASVSVSQDRSVINTGETVTVSAVLQNNMARDFVTTTWFVSGSTPGLSLNFVGDWFNKTIAPGGSRSDLHSTWTALATDPAGVYHKTGGIVGGLYNGDNFLFASVGGDNVHITVVPEPGTMAALGLGALAVLRRRKK